MLTFDDKRQPENFHFRERHKGNAKGYHATNGEASSRDSNEVLHLCVPLSLDYDALGVLGVIFRWAGHHGDFLGRRELRCERARPMGCRLQPPHDCAKLALQRGWGIRGYRKRYRVGIHP